MAIKQVAAKKAMENASGGKLIEASLSEIAGGWLALAVTDNGKKLVCAATKDCPAALLFKPESVIQDSGNMISVMELNSNNAAVLRRYLKWTSPSACGSKGLSLGFSDWLGDAGIFLAPLFSKRKIKPILVEYTPGDCVLVKRNFLEAIDAATWAVFATGYKEGYGASATGLKTEEDLVKVLLYGYSMLGFDFSDKINLEIDAMTDAAVEQKYMEFPQEFRDAVESSYLAAPVKVGNEIIRYTPEVVRRAVLEYGEVIMHAQSIYNSYLKNTPWDIDFEVYLSKNGKPLTPQEHYLVGYELTRNKVKLTAIGLNAASEEQALTTDLALHAAIAEACNYRLSFAKADLFAGDLGNVCKVLKGKAYFKMETLLWLSALQCVAAQAPELMAEIASCTGLAKAEAEDLLPTTATGKAYAEAYGKVLSPEQGNFAPAIRAVLSDNEDVSGEKITSMVEKYLKSL